MGVFEKIFKRPRVMKQVNGYFQMLDGYTPIFTDYDGGVYEMELTRSCIHAFANHCSKLLPVVSGPDSKGIQSILNGKPNPFMTTPQFLYKVATIYDTKNTCFIVPILDDFDRLVGFYPVNPQQTEVLDIGGEAWLRYTFRNGQKAAMELAKCGVVNKYLYNSDIKGEDNRALNPTLQLMNTQNQGIEEGIKNSASFRFMATVGNFAKADDLKKERKNWVKDNLGADSGGLALFPSTYTNVQQIQSVAKIVDAEQMKLIENRAFIYYGTNEKILRNEATGDDWSAYYEGKIEPFIVQLALAMTCMSYNQNERTRGNAVDWNSNRMQYMNNADKLQTSTQLFDRGILSTNDVMDIWNLPHVEDGDKRYIRKEYTEISQLDQVTQLQEQLTAAQNQLNATKKPPEDPEETEKEDGNDTERQDQA